MLTAILTIAIIIAAVILLYLFVLLNPGSKKTANYPGEFFSDYAHRGLHDAATPENSLAAFKKAVDAGFGIELDVQLSSDGQVMVFHDYTLDRMTGIHGKLSETPADELHRLKLNGTDETIPYLKQVLELVNGKVSLLVELKGENTNTELCNKVSELMKDYNGYYSVESFNPLLIHSYKKRSPATLCGLLITKVTKDRGVNPLNLILDCMALNCITKPDFIAYDHRYNKLSVSLCRNIYHLPEMSWTIRDEDAYNSVPQGTNAIFEGFIPVKK